MNNEKLKHDWVVDFLKHKFGREYKDIKINPEGDPDLVLANHGLVLAVVEVETEGSITDEKAEAWKQTLQTAGSKLILMVPKNTKAKVMELLWQKGIADKVGVGSYDIVINMP